MMSSRVRGTQVNRQRGASLIEFAFVMPLLVLILLGVIQWGIIFGAQLTLRNASMMAARMAALGSGGGYTDTEIKDSIVDAIEPLLEEANLTIPVDIERPYVLNATIADASRVRVVYNLPLFAPLVVPGSTGGAIQLDAESVMW